MKRIVIFLLLLYSTQLWSSYQFSLRKCLLLPVQDNLGGTIGYGVYEGVEHYLKDSDWCVYQSNSEILNILSHYKKNLETHLANPSVIKVLAEKTRTGSILKISLKKKIKETRVKLVVLASNGEDILYENKTIVNSDDVGEIAQTVKNFLEVYKYEIPYDGRITGVLGNQFTVDIGKNFGVYPKAKLLVIRPTRKKRHPLLKQVVSFETRPIADALAFHVNPSQTQASVRTYQGNKSQIQVGDWIVIDRTDQGSMKKERGFVDPKKYKFGSIGYVSIGPKVGVGSASLSTTAQTNKIAGTVYGLALDSELWLTRNIFFSIEIEKLFGGYSEEEGTITQDSNSADPSLIGLKAAYRYLPLGFFYGPQVNASVGYRNIGYNFAAKDSFVGFSLSGITLGFEGNVPLHKLVRMYIGLDFMVTSSYTEDATVHGDKDSSTNYIINFGAVYNYAPKMKLDGKFSINSTKVKFRSPTKTYSVKESALSLNVLFLF